MSTSATSSKSRQPTSSRNNRPIVLEDKSKTTIPKLSSASLKRVGGVTGGPTPLKKVAHNIIRSPGTIQRSLSLGQASPIARKKLLSRSEETLCQTSKKTSICISRTISTNRTHLTTNKNSKTLVGNKKPLVGILRRGQLHTVTHSTTASVPAVLVGEYSQDIGSACGTTDVVPDEVQSLVSEKLGLEDQIAKLTSETRVKDQQIQDLRNQLATFKVRLSESTSPNRTSINDRILALEKENEHLKHCLEMAALSPTPSSHHSYNVQTTNVEGSAISDAQKVELLGRSKSCNMAAGDTHRAEPWLGLTTSDELGGAIGPPPLPMMDASEKVLSEWDKQSCSSLSEISVACLQDRIQQMEETHYSTNEELQATLQELAELQDQLSDLQARTESLQEEKTALIDSLCRQSQRLDTCMEQLDGARQLLIQQSENDVALSQSEREQKLIDLLKSAEEEREVLLTHQSELEDKIQSFEQRNSSRNETGTDEDCLCGSREKLEDLEKTLQNVQVEHSRMEDELSLCRDECVMSQSETERLRSLLENQSSHRYSTASSTSFKREDISSSTVSNRVEELCREREELNINVCSLREELEVVKIEEERAREALNDLREKFKVWRSTTKTTVSALEERINSLTSERDCISHRLQESLSACSQWERQCNRALQEKRDLQGAVQDCRRSLEESQKRLEAAESTLAQERDRRKAETEEWDQFKNDLLVTVRVANDFKIEALAEKERALSDAQFLREKIRLLETNNNTTRPTSVVLPTTRTATPPSSLTTNNNVEYRESRPVLRPLVSPENQITPPPCENEPLPLSLTSRPILSRTDSRLSVKSLIDHIESQVKSTVPSSPTLSPTLDNKSPLLPVTTTVMANTTQQTAVIKSPVTNSAPLVFRRTQSRNDGVMVGVVDSVSSARTPLTPTPVSTFLSKQSEFRRNSYSEADPLAALAKNGGSRRNGLLKWCQSRTGSYPQIDITNFSSSWNDGMALCALLHTYLPRSIPYDRLNAQDKRTNFTIAFQAAESIGINTTLNINDMVSMERPDWQQVMSYVQSIYRHFEK